MEEENRISISVEGYSDLSNAIQLLTRSVVIRYGLLIRLILICFVVRLLFSSIMIQFGGSVRSWVTVSVYFGRWWWWLMFCGHFCVHGRLNGPSDIQGNETKSKMKHPPDIPMPRFKHGWQWSVAQHATARLWRRPLFRWNLGLEEYRFYIVHRKGISNGNVDTFIACMNLF